MNELNELFEQILHSEQSFKARINRLRELSTSIQQCQLDLQQTRERAHTLQGELVVKSSKLAEFEVKSMLLAVRKDILTQQWSRLNGTRRQLANELDTSNRDLEGLKQSFLDELVEFSQSYDLHDSGYKYREEQAKKKTCMMQDEMILLEAEVAEIDSQKEEVTKLEQELADVESGVQREQDNAEEFHRRMADQEVRIRQLEEDKVAFGQKATQDPEFIRFQHELGACRGCPEETECQSLSKELEDLQKQCYHKQMKQQLSLQRKEPTTHTGAQHLGRRPGHYNPYTHQYVPAPHMGQTLMPPNGGHTEENSNSNSDLSCLNGQFQEFLDDDEGELNLVDDEWLMGDGELEGSANGDHWDLDFDESELASLDSNLNDCNGGTDLLRSGHNDSGFGDDSSSYCGSFGSRKKYPSTTEGNGGCPRSTTPIVTRNRFTSGMQSLSRKNLPTRTTACEVNSQQLYGMKSGIATTAASSSPSTQNGKPAHQGPASSKRRLLEPCLMKVPVSSRQQRGTQKASVLASHSVVTDSPNPNLAQRKRPGQSIYKAPGQQQHNSGLPKSAKRVRFHY